MVSCTIVFEDKRFLNNLWFSIDPNIIRDNQNLCYFELKKYLLNNNIDLSTEDINSYKNSRLVLFIDVPRDKKYVKIDSQFWYAILNEAPCAYEKNWDKKYHDQFDKLFTWDESYVDDLKYFKIRLAYNLNYNDFNKKFRDRRLITMISGAKFSKYPGAIYNKRYDLIKWFCKTNPKDFDLYGIGWPQNLRPIFFSLIENRFPEIFKKFVGLFYSTNKVYKGRVDDKREVLSKYKFSICFENMENKMGFVTEKIFDSMCSGCIPIYLGATNIQDLIPGNCYIDARLFNSNRLLYNHIKSISEQEFNNYQKNIIEFLNSPKGEKFKSTFFAKQLGDEIIKALKINL